MFTSHMSSSEILPAGTNLQGGHFIIGKMLGQGGFGITYYADDTRLHRPVAIKEFFPLGCLRNGSNAEPGSLLSPADYNKSKTKFIDEARALAQFHHPGIVQIHTFFEENDTAYMVMEYVGGMTLAQWVEKSGPFSESVAVTATEMIGEALQVVHQAGLLHRDIKPENVMACDSTTPQTVRLVLIDFGLNKKIEETIGYGTRQLTNTIRFGTGGYAPPEQYLQHTMLGISTDIYAIGATLYYLLTGQAPVSAPERAMGAPFSAPHLVNPGISRTISDVVMWAMELNSQQRPQMMQVFLDGLLGSTHAITPPSVPAPSVGSGQQQLFNLNASPSVPSAPPKSRPSSTVPSTQLKPALLHTFNAHWKSITSVDFSPDGQTLASGSEDATVNLWNVATGKLLSTLDHDNQVTAIAFSPEGDVLVTGSDDFILRLWDIRAGILMRTWQKHTRKINSISFSRNGKILISGSEDDMVVVWNLPTGNVVRYIKGGSNLMDCAALSSNGSLLASGSTDGIKLWRTTTGTLLHKWETAGFMDSVQAIAFSQDDTVLITGDMKENARIWDVETGKLVRTFTKHRAMVTAIASSPDNVGIASGDHDGTVKLWNSQTGQVLQSLKQKDDRGTNSIDFSPDGQLLAVGYRVGGVKLWRVGS